MNILKWLTSEKYRFFYTKFRNVQKSMWELDFKIAKARGLREGIRQDRDRAIEASGNIDNRLKSGETLDADTSAQLLKQKDDLLDSVKRYEAQMKMIDNQINGVPAEGENPGENGHMDTLGSLAELRVMYKDYLNQI